MNKVFALSTLTCGIALCFSGTALSEGIERLQEEIWHPNPEQLESTVETGELPVNHDYGDTVLQSKDGMTVDVELLAKESGMSLAAAERAIKAQNEFARYADQLLSLHPGRIARMWIEPAPGTKANIQFVGKVPADIAKLRKPGNVAVSGGATISYANQVKRAQAAAKGLRKAGYVNSSTFYDPASDKIQLDIKVGAKGARPDPGLILLGIQEELRGTDLRDHIKAITRKDLSVKVIRGEGPIMEFDHARGGNWVRDDGFRECTSGWSVSGPSGDGIITAAHCSGLNQLEEENGVINNMTWRSQVFGAAGDVEYHTTNHIELDDFYARSGEIRDVNSIRSTLTMPGATVCEYGRSNNVRTCNHTVQAINVTVNYSIGTVSNLVRVSGDDSIGGDSGGGWSFNYTAWGVHSGSNGSQSFFTPVQAAEAALRVTIKR